LDDILGKFNALSIGQKIIVIAGPVLLIISFLTWYSVSAGPFSVNRSGWQSPGAPWSMLAVLVGVAMSAIILIQNLGTPGTIPDNVGGFTWPKIRLAGAGLAGLFILLKIVTSTDWDMGLGIFLAIIAVGAMIVGAFLDFQAERAAPPMPPAA
jgi:hypothetical protein